LKVEVLNLINRPEVRSMRQANTFGNANFGQTREQGGFMRIVQIMARFNF
jgi:hypothetical protein